MVILLRSRGARDIRKRGQAAAYLIVLVILLTYASAASHPTNIQVAVDTMRDANKASELRALSAQAVLRYSRHTGDRYLSRESARLLNHLSKPEIGRAPSQTCRIGVIGFSCNCLYGEVRFVLKGKFLPRRFQAVFDVLHGVKVVGENDHAGKMYKKPESSEFTHFHQPLEEDPRFKHVIDFIEKSITNRQNGQRSVMVIFADYLDTV